jgi:phage terminase small subunit
MLMKVQAAIAQCEKELGFTPVSRARVRVADADDEGNDFDGF